MKKKIFYVFLFLYTAVFSIAQDANDKITHRDDRSYLYNIDRSALEIQPAYRAALLAKTFKNVLNDACERSISINYMKYLQEKADKLRIKKQYEYAYQYYYDAALYYPQSLLLFKASEAKLMEILSRKNIYSIDILLLLDKYHLGIEFYQYEKDNDISVSISCFNKIKRQVTCFQDIYIKYQDDRGDIPIPKDEILHCKSPSLNIFQYEYVCE